VSIGKARQGAAQASGCWIRPAKRLAIYVRDGFTCAYCGTDLRNAAPADVTLDHLLPRSTGGSNSPTNLITCCRSCNSSRQDKPWVDYATGGARDRIEQLRNSPLNIELAKALIAGTAGDAELEAAR
jgi:5-methylcytosine-specific restriction endonuclease McrA